MASSSRTLLNAFNRIRASSHAAQQVTIQAAPWDDRNRENPQQPSVTQIQPSWNQQNSFHSSTKKLLKNSHSQNNSSASPLRISKIQTLQTQNVPNIIVPKLYSSVVSQKVAATEETLPNDYRPNNYNRARNTKNRKTGNGQNSLKEYQTYGGNINDFITAIKRKNTTEAWSAFLLLEGSSTELLKVHIHDMNSFLQLVRKSSHKFGQSENERLEAMERVFNCMKRVGFAPDTGTFVILANAYAQAGDLKKVMELFEEVTNLRIEEPKMKLAILCVAQAKAGQITKAQESFRNIIKSNPDIPRFEIMGAYNAVLDGLSHSRDRPDEALIWFSDAVNFHITPDGLTYDLMIEFYCNRFEFDNANKLMKKKEDQGFAPTTRSFNSLIRGLLRANKQGEVFNVFNQMIKLDVPSNATTYNYVLSSFQGDVDPVVVWELYISMLKSKIVPTRSTWASLARGIGSNNKNLRTAIESANGTPSKFLYRNLLDGYRHLNDCDGVLSVLDQYKQEEINLPSQWPVTLDVFNTVLSCLCEGGRELEANQVFEEIKKRKLGANQFTYNAMISLYSRSTINIVKARELFENMKASLVNPDSFTYNQIINSHWPANSPISSPVIEYAREFAQAMIDYNPKRDVVLHQALRHAGGGDAEAGLLILRSEKHSEVPGAEILDTNDEYGFRNVEKEISSFLGGLENNQFEQENSQLVPPWDASFSSSLFSSPFKQAAFAPRHPDLIGMETTNISQLF
ncbi:hypothetical protein HK096_004938 [Nowakowskiella sp. JEL0078]|nr:hypothetical protein HK096_004938 [Nowakowskiella sp. JEL0078]